MAVSTNVVSCAAGAYTALALDATNCSFRLRTKGGGRMVIAAAQPAAGETNYVQADPVKWNQLGSMTGTEDVYFMPNGSAAMEVEVIKG